VVVGRGAHEGGGGVIRSCASAREAEQTRRGWSGCRPVRPAVELPLGGTGRAPILSGRRVTPGRRRGATPGHAGHGGHGGSEEKRGPWHVARPDTSRGGGAGGADARAAVQ
jgi:hypothetical protein